MNTPTPLSENGIFGPHLKGGSKVIPILTKAVIACFLEPLAVAIVVAILRGMAIGVLDLLGW